MKIDQSFVRKVVSNSNDSAITQAIIAMAQSLGLSVIAEGVEEETQYDCLAQQGCPAFQGYFFGRPVKVEVLQAMIESDHFSSVCKHQTTL